MSNMNVASHRPTRGLVANLRTILPGISIGMAMLLAPIHPAHAQTANPPDFMTYQGYLVDATGAALGATTPVNYTVVFRIYDRPTGGSSLWAESQTVTVDKGNFSVVLGEGAPEGSEPRGALSALYGSNTASDRYIGITVKGLSGGDPEIAPRLRLLTSPYSFLSRWSTGLVASDGTSLLVPDSGRLRISQAIQSTGGNTRGTGAVDLQVLRVASQVAQVASGEASTISGGQNNMSSGADSVVSGGNGNTASGIGSAALGGVNNAASGNYATTVGGRLNTASGLYSLAAGRRARAGHDGAFVWGDGQDAEVASTGPNQFVVRAGGGMAINAAPKSDAALNVGGKITAKSLEVESLTVTGQTAAASGGGSGAVPVGGIIMWSGSENGVPSGWALCNGQTAEGQSTPDLRGRFVVGSKMANKAGTLGADVAPENIGATGGKAAVTLTTDHLPAHTHTATATVAEGGEHSHKLKSYLAEFDNDGKPEDGSTKDYGKGSGDAKDGTISLAGKHTHTATVTVNTAGAGKPFSTAPPYYAIAFIMRVK